MQTIVVASQKGGAGKTTLTAHLAVEAQRFGRTVVLDTDPQAGLAAWWNERENPTPDFVRPGAGELTKALNHCAAAGYAYALIDTPPAITDNIAATLKVADLVLIPARPSPNDMRAIKGTIQLVLTAGKPLVFVLNAVKPRVRLTAQATDILRMLGELVPVLVGDRADYAAAMVNGGTAPELEPAGRAADEIAALWRFIVRRLAGEGGKRRAAA